MPRIKKITGVGSKIWMKNFGWETHEWRKVKTTDWIPVTIVDFTNEKDFTIITDGIPTNRGSSHNEDYMWCYKPSYDNYTCKQTEVSFVNPTKHSPLN